MLKIIKIQNITFQVQESNKEIVIERTSIKGKLNRDVFKRAITNLTKNKKTKYYVNTSVKEYLKIISILKKNNFAQSFKKIVYSKGIRSIANKEEIVFKPIEDFGKKVFFNVYKKAIMSTKDPDFLEDRKKLKEGFKELLSKSKKWNLLALDKDKIIGILILERYKDYCSINFMSILPAYRGNGYAVYFLQKAEKEFYKADSKKWLESTSESNIPMIKALRKYGFKRLRRIYCFNRP